MEFYTGTGATPDGEETVQTSAVTDVALNQQTAPEKYRLVGSGNEDDDAEGWKVVRAVNTALALRMPLLVSGEPGSGKTQLGYAVAHELGKEKPLKFNTKSTSAASDLFYTYDAVRHFQARDVGGGAADPKNFIEYSPLGLAILIALPREARAPFLPDNFSELAGASTLTPERKRTYELLNSPEQHQTVVIIDEIDKAPLDFPNDLLHEIENMSFRVPELGGLETPSLDPSLKPIIFITTNSNRQLPDAFLRRCAYATIFAPKGEALQSILDARLEGIFDEGAVFVSDALAFYEHLRENEQLHKKPGTSELLQFLQAAKAFGAVDGKPISAQRDMVEKGLSLLGKREDDLKLISKELNEWDGV